MENSILHILVIWSKAKDYKAEILEDLRKDFTLLKVFKAHWDKDKFLQNYMVFYAHSQYHLTPNAYRDLLQGKVEHCGDDDFTVVILRDDHPHFETRLTSSGERKVNTRMFDKKTQYRALTGGGHKIHSSDDAWETNHDLTLMFGLNTEDFCNYFTLDGKEATFSQNCIGVGGYKSIQQFFYVLNNCIRYVVLRNHECIPNQYTVEGHGDIDLLCENKNWMAYLTAARPIFEQSYRVYHTIQIGNIEVPFDFRYVGDNYYDQSWQEDILKTRQLTKNLFYTPNPENQYYSLLYHAYIQKWEVKNDYHPKLAMYADIIGQSYESDVNACVRQLDAFMQKHEYEFVRPLDKSVVYNPDHIALSCYALRLGQFLKRLKPLAGDSMQFHSCIYEKKDSFIKIGSSSLIENEAKYLNILSDCDRVPRVIRIETDTTTQNTLLEISRVPGIGSDTFFADSSRQTWANVRSYIIQCMQILKVLAAHNIAHRDFLPGNLMVSPERTCCRVFVIDFGWSTNLANQDENRPKNLGAWLVSSDNSTDSFALASQLIFYWYDLYYVRLICYMLRKITNEEAKNTSVLIKKYDRILLVSRLFFSFHDVWRLFCRRHQQLRVIKNLFKHF